MSIKIFYGFEKSATFEKYLHFLYVLIVNNAVRYDMQFEAMSSLSILTSMFDNLPFYTTLLEPLLKFCENCGKMINKVERVAILQKCVFSIGNLAADSGELLERIVQNIKFIQGFLNIFYENDPVLISTAIWCLGNFSRKGTEN